MEKDGVEEAFDRFSNLPVPIIHHIMSFLPTTKDVTRVAVLSKTLNSVCHSYPILDFDQRSWKKIMGFDSFLDFMQKSLQQRRESNIDIEIFKLCVIDHDGKSDQRIDESICFAIEHNVKKLDLRFGDYWIRSRYKVYGQLYTLPKTVTTKSIVVLNLVGLAFKFEDLIPSLNLVEHLSIELCSVSSNFTISSTKLKTLKLQNCKGLKTIVVDAVNLQYFSHSTFTSSSEISLGDCKSLKNVMLDNTAITDDWLKNHLSKLLLLETLILKSCKILGEIDICHQKLKHLALLNCDKLVKAKIEAPNLVSFYFYNKSRFPVITLQCSSQLYADLILFGISPTNDEQFMNFKNFLGSFGHCKSLSLTLPDMVFPF